MQSERAPLNLEDWVTPLLGLCREAGEAIREHYDAPDADEYVAKSDDSPLTQADLASHRLLCAGLERLAPDIPVLSEESAPVDFTLRRQWPRHWLVDPLDGTREFLARTGEFTINVALIEAHRPVLGVLYLPLERKACVGIPGRLARHYTGAADGDWLERPMRTRSLRAGEPLLVTASRRSRSEGLQQCLQWLEAHWQRVTPVQVGSALKFCQLARGEGDFYPRFSPCCEWDTAAGQAVLEAAGGCVLGLDGAPLRYNFRESLSSPPYYAIADTGHPLWRSLLAARQQ